MYLLIHLLMLLPAYQTGHKRVIELYTHAANDPLYLHQLKLLSADQQGLDERDIIIKKFVFDEHNASGFKKRSAGENFTVILIGKDGGEKYRSDQPLSLKKLYALIDAMPMRREEMRKPAN